jgi:hypothetical protein
MLDDPLTNPIIKPRRYGRSKGSLILWSSRKNVYLALPKHVGGPNNIHNIAATSFHDFDNKRASVRSKVSTYTKDALIKYETRLVWLNNLMVCYIEREIFKGLDLQKVKKAFQKRKTDKCNCLGLLDVTRSILFYSTHFYILY